MFTRKPRLQPAEFLITGAKRLLQHNRTIADIRDRQRQRHAGAVLGGETIDIVVSRITGHSNAVQVPDVAGFIGPATAPATGL